jgi:hypothetical protein
MYRMNRLPLVLSSLAAAMLLLANQASQAGQEYHVPAAPPISDNTCYPPVSPPATMSCTVPCCPPAVAPAPTKRPVCTDAELVDELISIINETNAPDTLVVTVMILEPLGYKARAAVPAIIRAAERLKVWDGSKVSKRPKAKEEYAEQIVEGIMKILDDAPAATSPCQLEGRKERKDKPIDPSEDVNQINADWRRFWMNDQPSNSTPVRVHGSSRPDVPQETTPVAQPTPPLCGGAEDFFPIDVPPPDELMDMLLSQSADLRKINEEWCNLWMNDQPSPRRSRCTYARVHGGIGPGVE